MRLSVRYCFEKRAIRSDEGCLVHEDDRRIASVLVPLTNSLSLNFPGVEELGRAIDALTRARDKVAERMKKTGKPFIPDAHQIAGKPVIDCNVHGYSCEDDEIISYKVHSSPPFKVLKIRQRDNFHAEQVCFYLGRDGAMDLGRDILAAAIKEQENEKEEKDEEGEK